MNDPIPSESFDRTKFSVSSGYVEYLHPDGKPRFVARFKHQAGSAHNFIKFIAANFTVDEYFTRLNAGESPLPIAESKGYLLPHIRRWLDDAHLPQTLDGLRQLLELQATARK